EILNGYAHEEEVPERVEAEDGVAMEHARGDLACVPGQAAVGGVSDTGLSKGGLDGVELTPTDRHPARVGGIDGDRRLVGGVAEDVGAVRIDVHLNAGEAAERDDRRRRRAVRDRRRMNGGTLNAVVVPDAL